MQTVNQYPWVKAGIKNDQVKLTAWSEIADFQWIFARSVSTVLP